jgi:methionyl-tRNA synthetase
MDKPKYYLTSPIYYANSRPHVGSAYTTIVCDVIARYKRMCGYEVAYLTGTDEHGVNIERAAEKLGVTPQELVDKNQRIFRDLWKLLGISYTTFIRTTSSEHERAVQTLVRRTMDRDKNLPAEKRSIYKAKYEGRYCIYDNLYVSDTPEPANCQICGRPAELISEENYFFRLSAYQDKLLALYKDKPEWVQPDFRMNEVKSFVEAGLKDVSISRKTIKWGIPWPDDSEHVFYVWYDALTSYMSGIGYANEDEKKREQFDEFWPANLHMIGKEIIRFHAVYWPAFLMAAGLPLPEKIFAHGWLLFEQEKMSKSKGNVAYPEPIVKAFDELTGAKVGNDALRYYLLRETVFGQDGNFSREALITRYNADLANGLGNLASRTLTMIDNYFEGVIPEIGPADDAMEANAAHLIKSAAAHYDRLQFSECLQEIWQLVSLADVSLAHEKPWKQITESNGKEVVGPLLYRIAAAIRVVSVLAHPVIPDATRRIWAQLGQTESLDEVDVKQLQWRGLIPGTKIGKLEGVFPRADKKEASERIDTMENEIRNPASARKPGTTQPATATESGTTEPSAPSATTTSATAAPTAAAPAAAVTNTGASAPVAAPANAKITIEDFAKVELRVGVVKTAERVQGADKLLKLTVDIGDEVRQVLAGIALAYTPEELVGRKVVVVVNLAPRKMRGVESNGMLLAASAGADGKPVLCTFAEDIPAGAKVR